MHQLIGERETLFRDLGLDSAAAFRRLREDGPAAAGVRAADVFLVIDNWGAPRGEMEGIDAAVLDIANRGLGVAVHLVLTANRWADLRMTLRDSISGRLELRLNDPRTPRSTAGRPASSLGDARARHGAARPPVPGGAAAAGQRATAPTARRRAGGHHREDRGRLVGSAAAPPVRMLPERVTVAQLELRR